jgi:hypothetical protein
MAFKLIESAQVRWRAVNAPHLVALVRAGHDSKPANSSNDPSNTPNTPPPKRSSSTGLDYCSVCKRELEIVAVELHSDEDREAVLVKPPTSPRPLIVLPAASVA